MSQCGKKQEGVAPERTGFCWVTNILDTQLRRDTNTALHINN